MGLFFGLLGIFLILLSFKESFFILIYAIPLFVIGIILLLNKNEDKIEERKDIKMSRSKR